jgi:putative FmdB family regulatory protein
MPIYEYACTSCGKEFEVMQKMNDAPLKNCDCSSAARVERKLSLTSFHLQGGGWNSSGYANTGGGSPAPAKHAGHGCGGGGG